MAMEDVAPVVRTDPSSGAAGEGNESDTGATSYPPYVKTDEERRRFDLARERAAELFDAPPDSEQVWMAARALYRSDIPTGEASAAPPGSGASTEDSASAERS